LTSTAFIPGATLNEMFYHEVVGPILARNFPALAYSAALIGYGSDVLGYDTPISTDHNWGPRLTLFVSPEDHAKYEQTIHVNLQQELPTAFRGYSVNYSQPDANDNGVQRMQAIKSGRINHLIHIGTVPLFFERYLGLDPNQGIGWVDWLTLTEQALLQVTHGHVYHDELGLVAAIAKVAYFPRDIWLYRMAAQWQRISQQEAFVGRCGDVGDELGSRINAARVVRDLIKLAFLIARQYTPYDKWLGTAFARLNCARQLTPIFARVLDAREWKQRETPLCEAYQVLAEMQNSLGVGARVEPTITPYFERPYRVIFAGRYAQAIAKAIQEPAIKKLRSLIGGVDQFADCTDVTSNIQVCKKLGVLYQ
jgi:hypothetical protein